MYISKENTMLRNAFILSFAAITSKILGAFYQAFLYRIVGPEGISLYMRGINIYTILLSISAAGIPIAISKLMSEEIAKGCLHVAYKIFRLSFILLGFIGAVFSIGLYFLAPFFADILFDSPITWVIQALSPAIFIVTVMGALRGFFQGQQNMVPTAYSQIIEQAGRVIFSVSITLFYLFELKYISVAKIINGVALGPLIGSIFGIFSLFYFFKKERKQLNPIYFYKKNLLSNNISSYEIINKIIFFAVPTTISALLPTLIDFSDMIIIPRVLKDIGLISSEANCLLGYFSGAVLTLINIIILISSSFATSLIPSISEANSTGNIDGIRRKTVYAIKFVILISLPFIFGIYFLGKPVLEIIFGSGDANRILQYGSLMLIFMSIYHSTTGILQGIGKVYIPLISLSIGLLLNIILLNFLIRLPFLNILGASLSHTISFLVASLINYIICKKNINFKMNWSKWLLKSIITSISSVLAGTLIYFCLIKLLKIFFAYYISNFISLIIAIIISSIIYLALLVFFKVLKKEEVKNLSKVSIIFRWISKS